MEQAKVAALSPDPQTVQLAEHRRNFWCINAGIGVTPERAAEPDYWVHCTTRLKEKERVELMAHDGSWFAEYIVDKVIPTIGIRMWCINLVDRRVQRGEKPQSEDRGQPEDYTVGFGGAHRWRVVRNSDKVVVHKDEPDEASASAWLAQYLTGAAVAA